MLPARRSPIFHTSLWLRQSMAKSKAAAKSSRKQYARLAPRVKTLKEGTIRKKWRKLTIGTQAKVADLLRTVERPALTHGNNDRRGVEAQAFVSELVEQYAHTQVLRNYCRGLMRITRLILRLPRMPFPPGTDELSFDFESTINRQVCSWVSCVCNKSD